MKTKKENKEVFMPIRKDYEDGSYTIEFSDGTLISGYTLNKLREVDGPARLYLMQQYVIDPKLADEFQLYIDSLPIT